MSDLSALHASMDAGATALVQEMDREDEEVRLAEAIRLEKALTERAKILEAECARFEKENTILQKNITKLYDTTKEELEKKDQQIKTLRSSEIIAEIKEEKDQHYSTIKPHMPWDS